MKKTIIIWVIVIALFIEFLIVIAPGEVKFVDTNPTPTPTMSPLKLPSTKLEVTDIEEGTGKAVKPGDSVVIHYKGTFADGKEFESSYTRNQPLETTIGTGQVIKGWDEGIPGMKIGGKRKLVIPPDMGYGEQGSPPTIPPNATLTFEVELLDIK